MALRAFAIALLTPLFTLALEPSNPTTFCTRFIGENDVKNCESRMKDDNSDWYAATVCNLQQEDATFWKCWEQIQGQSFNLQSLQKCDDDELEDAARTACLKAAQGSPRAPASAENKLFQPLKSKKKTR